MKLILHIGNHKTGTTTIQNSLYNQKDYLLKEYSFLYPETFLIKGAHHYLPTILLGNKTLFGKNLNYSFDRLLEIFKLEIKEKQPKVVFLSSEEFFRLNTEQIAKIKPLFDLFDKVEILAYLRNQPDHIESSYKFGILWEMTQKTNTFNSLFENVVSSNYHNYDARLNQWPNTFSNIELIVKDFSEEVKKGFLHSFYLDVLKMNIIVKEEKNNASLSRLSSLILKVFNSIDILSDERNKIIDILIINDKNQKIKESFFTKEQYN